jgi:hypothetical protein
MSFAPKVGDIIRRHYVWSTAFVFDTVRVGDLALVTGLPVEEDWTQLVTFVVLRTGEAYTLYMHVIRHYWEKTK